MFLIFCVANVQCVTGKGICLREFIITCLTPNDLLSQKLVMPFKSIVCDKGRQ